MAPTPEWFFGLMMTQVVPIVIACMVAGAVLGLVVKALRAAAGRAVTRPRRRY